MSLEGAFWKDPPGYFEQLVYPAYVDAHRSIFTVRDFRRSPQNILTRKWIGW